MNRKDRLILTALVVITILGACLRLFYFAQIQSNPLPEVATQLEPFDEYRFMSQAKEFLETNWLGKTVPS